MISFISAAGIPLLFIVYATVITHVGWSVAGVLDHAAMALLFLAAFGALLGIRRRWLRIVSTLACVFAMGCFFLLNTLHFRFFSTWGEVNAVQQWNDLISVWSGIQSLLWPADLIFFLGVPIALAGVSVATARLRRYRRVRLLLLAAGCLAAHAVLASPEILYRENNPLLYALRQRFSLFPRHPRVTGLAAEAQLYQATNPTLYRNPGRDDFPLMKIPRAAVPRLSRAFQKPPNVVVILMESVRAYESGAYGSSPSYTPQIDRLAREGLLFENFYANGSQTVRSEFAIHASFMPRMIGSPEYVTDPEAPFLTWPMILRRRGYHTMWIGSYTPTYDNKQAFQSHHGIESFYWGLPKGIKKTGWGPLDEDLFNYAVDVLSKQKSPYFAQIMTLTNHYPWDDGAPTASQTPPVRGEAMYKKYADGIYYTDYAIGKFFDRIRQMPEFENTLFIITGDHGIWLFPDDPLLAHSVLRQEAYFRVPLVFWSPGHLKPGVVRTLGSQIDLGPTILDLLGIYETNYFLGTSLLRNDVQRRFVLMVQDGRWNLREGQLYTYDVGPQVFKSHYPFDEEVYERVVKGREMGHITFTYEGDFLRDRHPRPLQPLQDAVAVPRRDFAEGALRFYQELFDDKKITPADVGITTSTVKANPS